MPFYRQVLIVNPTATAEQLATSFKRHAASVISSGGVFRNLENRGIERLGYPVEDRRSGTLQRFIKGRLLIAEFNSSPEALQILERETKLDETVLRFMTFQCRDKFEKELLTRQPKVRTKKQSKLDIASLLGNNPNFFGKDEE